MILNFHFNEKNAPKASETVVTEVLPPKDVFADPVGNEKQEEEKPKTEEQFVQNEVVPATVDQEEEGKKQQTEDVNADEPLIPESTTAPVESNETTDLWGERTAEDAAIEAMLENHQEEEPDGYSYRDNPLLPPEEPKRTDELKIFDGNSEYNPPTDEATVPVTTMTTSSVNNDVDVPPPRPPKQLQRQTSDIFPDEQQQVSADPFAMLASPTKDPLMEELFGAVGSPDDDLSQSPVHFESVHRRAPPPPVSQPPPRPQHQPQRSSSSAQLRASITETAGRFKKWLK